MFTNIPKELQDLRQWVLWKYEVVEGRETKVPYSVSGHKANIHSPSSWSSFAEVLAAGPAAGASGIGLVLTEADPYTGIDIDNKPTNPASEEELKVHQKILDAFPSYTEKSVGGSGYHIIIKGKVPRGTDRGHVGVYSSGRYLTFTGQVVRDAPILDCQSTLDILFNEMQPAPSVALDDREELQDDRDLVEMAMSAVNADKFNELCAGNWQALGYPSQSEADFALLSILAFYSPSNEQVRRIFRMSHLGKREKAIRNNSYLDFALGKIRAQEPPPINMEEVKSNVAALLASMDKRDASVDNQETFEAIDYSTGEITSSDGKFPIDLPPGLVGELAQYFYQTSIRPVPEISLIAAIGAVAGVVGRSYNISGQGLAQYLILLARTGTGKEAISSGISRLFHTIQPRVPMVTQFSGPAVFASGPALHRVLSEKPCFVSVLGEFGFTVQRLSNPRANSAEITLKQLILDSFGKSGHGQVLQPSVYSDKEKNINPVQSPNMTIIGESTPESFYDGLDQTHIASGFLSRFLILEYTGDRPYFNEHTDTPLPASIMQKFCDLVTVAVTASSSNKVCQVQMTPEAKATLDNFNLHVDSKIRGANDVIREIWNRAHLKALKMAGLIAVGCNPYKPVVDILMATWAINLVEHDGRTMQKRFDSGDVGQGDSKQMNDMQRAIEGYFKHPTPSVMKEFGELHKNGVIPYKAILRRVSNIASFKNDRLGSTTAIKKTLQAMEDSGMLIKATRLELLNKFKFSGEAYAISGHWS